ncbi:MAG: response regulator transcription factor [Bacteroidales bacterium]|nr:response regulator transcription factor [Bacteroidales bacterium]MCF8458120.1 response regulator transcription factor [Bacteroidales bacterium]
MKEVKIILADDHQIIIDGLDLLLSSQDGYKVVRKVTNGSELLKDIELFQPDLVISDIEMPGLNGIEASKEIKKCFPNVKIIILSMYKEPSLIRQLIQLGVDGYLTKTSDQEELLAGIDRVVGGQKYFGSDVTVALTNSIDNQRKAEGDLDKLAQLSERENEILKLVCEGLNNKEIGERLFISHRTVDTHRTNLMRKLDVHSVVELIRFAIRNGIIEG